MIKYLLTRPVTLTMTMVLVILLGVIAYTKINRQILPSGFSYASMFVRISNFNLSPEETDKQIGDPISGMLRTVKNIDTITATSTDDSLRLNIRFLPSANMVTAYSEVQSVIDRSREFLPENVEVRIFSWNPDTEAIMWIGYLPEAGTSRVDAKQIFENKIKPKILRINGVADVGAFGFRSPNAVVKLNPVLMESYGISPSKVVNALRQSNLTASLGTANKIPVVLKNEVTSIDEIKNVEINPGIRIRHLGTVFLESPQENRMMRINGNEFYWMSISKKDGENILQISELAIKELKKIEESENGKIKFDIMWNQGEEISSALKTITTTAVSAGVIAFIVVLVFLRNLSLTILVTTSIPLSVLITIVYLYFGGESLNVLSMMGIMLSCGMVVDNAIVVAEAIFGQIEKGVERTQAIINGVKEVGIPVLMGTATTIAVFLPLILMNGDSNFSFFMAKLGIPVCIALVGSLVIALVIIPHLIKHAGSKVTSKGQQSKYWLKIQRTYRRILEFTLRKRFETVLALVLFSLLTFAVDKQFAPTDTGEDNSRFYFSVQFDESLSFQYRNEYLIRIEKSIDTLREEFAIEQVQASMNRNNSRASLSLRREVGTNKSNGDLRKILNKELPVIAGVQYDIQDSTERSDAVAQRFMNIRLKGLKTEVLSQLAEQVKESIANIDGVSEVKIETEDAAGRNVDIIPSSVVNIRDITANDIANEVRSYLTKVELFELEEKYPVIVESALKITNLVQIGRLEVKPGVDVSAVAQIQYAPKTITPRRTDGALSQDLKIFFKEGLNVTEKENLQSQVMNLANGLELPPGYMLGRDAFRAEQRDNSDMMFALAMALILVFLIMGVLFESTILPFVIMFSIPVAFLGSMWMSVLTGTASGIMGKLGLVILVGVVVNNGIVLIDLIIKKIGDFEIAEKMARERYFENVADACEARLRPVLMTASTTVLSLLPMALGASNLLGIPFAPLGHAIIGGLICSTMITLLLIPVTFTLAKDFEAFIKSTVSRKIRFSRQFFRRS